MSYYVYAHINPETKQPFYIGKGTRNRCKSRHGRSPAWRRYVGSLLDRGLTYGIEIRHVCDSELDAIKLEQQEIIKELDSGRVLFNFQAPQQDSKKVPQGLILDKEVVVESENVNGALATYVRSKRKQVKLTQPKFAEKAGVGLRFIRELEGGKPTLRMDTVNKVLWMFGCELAPVKANRD